MLGRNRKTIWDRINRIKNIMGLDIKGDLFLHIIENYIYRNITIDSNINKIEEMYFYTTIPDDLPKVQEEIGTTIRDFDDTTIDEWGIHCVLHWLCPCG